jgi:hypothetical protein
MRTHTRQSRYSVIIYKQCPNLSATVPPSKQDTPGCDLQSRGVKIFLSLQPNEHGVPSTSWLSIIAYFSLPSMQAMSHTLLICSSKENCISLPIRFRPGMPTVKLRILFSRHVITIQRWNHYPHIPVNRVSIFNTATWLHWKFEEKKKRHEGEGEQETDTWRRECMIRERRIWWRRKRGINWV